MAATDHESVVADVRVHPPPADPRESGFGRFTVSFIVPVRDDAERVARCLRTIAANDYPADLIEWIVADNGSSDASADVARSLGAKVLMLPDLRVSALRNRAAATARGDLIAFIDADHEIVPTWIGAATDLFRDDRVGGAGAIYLSPPSGTWTQRMYGVLRGRTTGRRETLWLGSGNLVVRRAAFDRVGGFDETLHTCEDVDFCQRLRAAGFRLVADERLASVHMGDPRTLRELFLAERWRGRDNLRVSLRRTPAPRDLPSILIPIVDAAAIIAGSLGLVAGVFMGARGFGVTAIAVAAIVGLALPRAVQMVVSAGLRTARDVSSAFLVALAYDVARACSLIFPASHRRGGRVLSGLAARKAP